VRDILFLAHRLPWPPDRGDKIRSYHLLRYLCDRARVHLVTFAEDMVEMASADTLQRYVASMHVEWRSESRGLGVLKGLLTGQAASVALFNDRAIHRRIAGLLAEEDIGTIFAFSGQMAQFVPPDFSGRFLMDFVDVDSQKFAAYAKHGPLSLRWLYGREARLLGRYEQSVARRADRSLFVSDAESALFRKLSGLDDERVTTIENGIDLDYFNPDADFTSLDRATRGVGPLLVFTGQMDYLPNIDAVMGFANRVFPLIRDVRPDVRFAIVGRNPPPEIERLADRSGFIVTGSVPDVRPWIVTADVVVAPLSIARGIQNKVLEAMAMARLVIASPAAAEGVDAVPDRDFIVADEEAMTTLILNLLQNPARAATIGRQACAQIKSRYSWTDRLAPLAALLEP
jgi:sugar transferase (PEP-CTERM/EpsH1 system associated)